MGRVSFFTSAYCYGICVFNYVWETRLDYKGKKSHRLHIELDEQGNYTILHRIQSFLLVLKKVELKASEEQTCFGKLNTVRVT